TSDGYKGLLLALNESDLGLYRITLDGNGQETHREKLRPAASMIRFGQPATTQVPNFAGRLPKPIYKAGDWNSVQAIVDADILRGALNAAGTSTGLGAGVTEDESVGFGSIGFYVGGSGEVRFKEVGYKDLGVKETPLEKISNHFRMQRLDEYYYSWGIT